MQFNYGIVSTAAITKRFIGAVRECKGVVVAAASRSLTKAKEFCLENKIPKAYGTYEELYKDPKVSIVYIATNNGTHVQEINNALKAGKHVLCEKPIALSKKDAAEVFTAAKAKGLFLMEMQKSVFLPVTNLIKYCISSGHLGKLHQIEMSASFKSPKAPWMHDPKQGGVVYGSASYTIEYLDYLISPKNTQVRACASKESSGTVDAVSINLKMDQVLISSHITMRADSVSRAVFYFEHGKIEVPDYWKATKCVIEMPDGTSEKEFPVEYEMQFEVGHVQDCLEQGMIQSPIMTKKRSILCCSIVDEIFHNIDA